MTNLFEFLKRLDPTVDKIFEYPIFDSKNEVFAWSSIVRDNAGYPYSGGSDFQQEIARSKALYEGIERAAVKRMYSEKHNKLFLLDQFPSTNGFACGPSEDFTIKKAIFEGFERYLWDLWIDKKISLKLIDSIPDSKYISILEKSFEQIEFYCCEFQAPFLQHAGGFHFLVCIGTINKGIFWGSHVNSDLTVTAFEHALIEAQRNLNTFKSGSCTKSLSYEDQILQKYGENGQNLFSPQLGNCLHKIDANFQILQTAELANGIWIARALVDGFLERRDPSRMAFW